MYILAYKDDISIYIYMYIHMYIFKDYMTLRPKYVLHGPAGYARHSGYSGLVLGR